MKNSATAEFRIGILGSTGYIATLDAFALPGRHCLRSRRSATNAAKKNHPPPAALLTSFRSERVMSASSPKPAKLLVERTLVPSKPFSTAGKTTVPLPFLGLGATIQNFPSLGSIANVVSQAYDTVRWILGEKATHVLAHADTVAPAKADLINLTLAESLEYGRNSPPNLTRSKKGSNPDYACAVWEFLLRCRRLAPSLPRSFFLRKGLAPELELHGAKASLASDRLTGSLTLVKPNSSPAAIERIPDAGFGNRFQKHVFPALRRFLTNSSKASAATEHP